MNMYISLGASVIAGRAHLFVLLFTEKRYGPQRQQYSERARCI